jgi:hypothetical protein
MKTVYFLPFLVLLAGCGTPDTPRDPLAQFYQPYEGLQTNWPTGVGSFITDRYGVIFYHGLPTFPYTVVGRYERPNLPLNKLAESASFHGVQSVCLSEQPLLAIHQDKSITGVIANGHFATAIDRPGDTYMTTHVQATAYLIKPVNPADFMPPTSSALPLGNTNISIVHSPRQR